MQTKCDLITVQLHRNASVISTFYKSLSKSTFVRVKINSHLFTTQARRAESVHLGEEEAPVWLLASCICGLVEHRNTSGDHSSQAIQMCRVLLDLCLISSFHYLVNSSTKCLNTKRCPTLSSQFFH